MVEKELAIGNEYAQTSIPTCTTFHVRLTSPLHWQGHYDHLNLNNICIIVMNVNLDE